MGHVNSSRSELLQLLEHTEYGPRYVNHGHLHPLRRGCIRLIDGEILLVPVRGGVGELASIRSFNEVGTMIWQAVQSQEPKDWST